MKLRNLYINRRNWKAYSDNPDLEIEEMQVLIHMSFLPVNLWICVLILSTCRSHETRKRTLVGSKELLLSDGEQ